MKLHTKIAVGCAAVLAAALHAGATVTTVGWYQLGEKDSPVGVDGAPGDSTTVDSSGNGFDLTKNGNATYRADTALLAPQTSISMQFQGAVNPGFYQGAALATGVTTTVALELWVKPALASDSQAYLVWNGRVLTTPVNGYGFFQNGTSLILYVPGATFDPFMTVDAGQWLHLGLVFDSAGNGSLYTNGVLDTAASFGPGMSAPTPSFFIGSAGDLAHPFTGEIDNVRVFTFTGAFNPRDFLLDVPEPSAVVLAGLGASVVLLARRGIK